MKAISFLSNRTLQKSVLVIFVLVLFAFKGEDKSELQYRNYVTAVRNKTNFQHYLVVRVMDVNKNEVREFCTLGCFFRNALHKEWNLDYDKLSDDLVMAKASLNSPRLFELKDSTAIQYLAMDLYSADDLLQLEKLVDFKKLAKEILTTKKWEKTFGEDEKLMRMYAHELFNKGIMTGEDITAEAGILKFPE